MIGISVGQYESCANLVAIPYVVGIFFYSFHANQQQSLFDLLFKAIMTTFKMKLCNLKSIRLILLAIAYSL